MVVVFDFEYFYLFDIENIGMKSKSPYNWVVGARHVVQLIILINTLPQTGCCGQPARKLLHRNDVTLVRDCLDVILVKVWGLKQGAGQLEIDGASAALARPLSLLGVVEPAHSDLEEKGEVY